MKDFMKHDLVDDEAIRRAFNEMDKDQREWHIRAILRKLGR